MEVAAVRHGHPWRVLGASIVVACCLTPAAEAQDAVAYFKQNCVSCHTIGGGRITGPDLKDVGARRDRAWLNRFIQNPKAVIDSGDPYAKQLLDESRGVIMPTLPSMTPALSDALLALIEAESKLEKSQFAGTAISDRPFTAQDIATGHALFNGTTPLKNGGAACLSCHTLNGLGGLGGGKLAPDLTKAYERLLGRKGTTSWLTAPATVTMQAVFKNNPLDPEEILALTALMEERARSTPVTTAPGSLNFLLFGLGGAAVGLVSFDALWKRRFRAVRRPLVQGRPGSRTEDS
jgi:mono/diheme cytochrome c family protein